MALADKNMKGWTEPSDGYVEFPNTDTDSGISGSTRGLNDRTESSRDLRGSSQESLTSPCLSPEFMSPKKFTLELNTFDESPECDIPGNSPSYHEWSEKIDENCLQLRVEEHIEEITVHQYSDDFSDGSGSEESLPKENNKIVSKHKSQVVSEDELPSIVLPLSLPSMDLEYTCPQRISFPEFGADLVEVTSEEEAVNSSDVILDIHDWEENWLFCKQKTKSPSSFHSGTQIHTAVEMLIPNPIDCILPVIGDQDIDELSELSDNSGSLVSINSIEEEIPKYFQTDLYFAQNNGIEIMDEMDSQKNLEHTEHYSLPHPTKHITHSDKHYKTQCSSDEYQIHQKEINRSFYRPFKKDEETNSRKNGIPKLCAKEDSRIPFPANFSLLEGNMILQSEYLKFTDVLVDQNVLEGRILRLSCKVAPRTSYNYRWYRNGKILPNDDRHTICRESNTLNLYVFDMTASFSGEYAIICYTSHDFIWTKCQVIVQENKRDLKPPFIVRRLTDTRVETGADLHLSCQVSGHPEPRITFLRNGEKIDPSETVSIENDPYGTWTLHIKNVKTSDQGTICAVATNRQGQCKSSAVLEVSEHGEKPSLVLKKCLPSLLEERITEEKIQKNGAEISVKRSDEIFHKEACSQPLPQPQPHSSDENLILNESSLFRPPIPGTIAEREHKKWLEAKPIINNPYSPEKLSQRLQSSQSRYMSYGGSSLPLPDSIITEDGNNNWKSQSNLEKYSRDYLIGGSKIINQKTSSRESNRELKITERYPCPVSGTVCDVTNSVSESLVPIKPFQPSNWKEELRNVRLDVSEKVDELQRKIDDIQRDWQLRISQRARRNKSHNRHFSQRKFGKDPTIYSSSEVLNLTAKENYKLPLWKSTSVGDLSHSSRNLNKTSDSSRNSRIQTRTFQEMASSTDALSDDTVSSATKSGHISMKSQSGLSYRSLDQDPYQSDKSSDADDVPQLPSVKALASKFDSGSRKYSKKKQASQNEMEKSSTKSYIKATPSYSKNSMHEIHHSLTARSVQRYFKKSLPVNTIPLQTPTEESCGFSDTENYPPRNMPSPEHLGIPSNKALIKPRPTFSSHHAGDTSDDAVSVNVFARKTARRKHVTGIK